MTDKELIHELVLTLKSIRAHCENPHPNISVIHRKADEAITETEKLNRH